MERGSGRLLYACAHKTDVHGLGLVARHQLAGLVSRGWQVDLIARSGPGIEEVHEVPWPGAFDWLLKPCDPETKRALRRRLVGHIAVRELRRRDYEAVITWNGLGWRILPVAETLGVPAFLNCGNHPTSTWRGDLENQRARWPFVSRQQIRGEYFTSRAHVLATSEHARRRFVEGGCDEARVSAIGRGFDPAVFHPPAPRPERPFRLLFCGRLSERKGVFRLLELWRAGGFEDAELWMCGPIPDEHRERIESLATPSVKLLGYRADVADVMRQCHAQILLSSNEGQAKALLEGAACGLATIASRETGFPFEMGDIGHDVDPSDTAGVLEAVRQLVGAPDRLRGLSERAARLMAQTYTWEHFAGRFVETFEKALEGPLHARARRTLYAPVGESSVEPEGEGPAA